MDEAQETIAAPPAVTPEVIPPGTPVTPPQQLTERLPSMVSDSPVPYYTRVGVPDDIPQFSPRFELSPREVKLGMIASVEASFLQPFIHNSLNSGTLPVGNIPEAVQMPTAQPAWTVMPRVDLGYRFEQGLGELHVSFQFLGGQGTQTFRNFDTAGAGTVTSRLNLDVFDLDYAFTEFNPGRIPGVTPALLVPGRLGLNLRPEDDPYPTFRLKLAFGARGANVFFDSTGFGQQILHERVTNNFAGGGMHASIDISKPMPRLPALAVFARFEVSGLIGDVTQSFTRTEILPGGGTATGFGRIRNIDTGVPVIDVYAGMSYAPHWFHDSLRVTGGYRLQQWWYLGSTASSDASLFMQGFFVRGEFGY